MNPLLTEVKQLLQEADFPWAVCGGFGLDLFLDEEIRTHGDMDICVFEENRQENLRYMLERDWKVYEFRGMGKVRPMGDERDQYHQFFHTGIRKLNYLEFLFNRAEKGEFLCDSGKGIRRKLTDSIRYRDEIPYLAPEIALLYKASRHEEEKNRWDFERVYPRMDQDQQNWLLESLKALYPQGHPWIP